MSYQMTFENTLDEDVTLQINEGNHNCQNNPTVWTGQVVSGGSKVYLTDAVEVCYRRTADPSNPGNGLWTVWVGFSPNDINTPVEIDLGLL